MGFVVVGLATAIAIVVGLGCAEGVRRGVARALGQPVQRRLVFASPRDGTRAKRFAVVAVGPIGAYVGAVVLAFAAHTCNGIYDPQGHLLVAEVLEGYPAVGLVESGDIVVAVDGTPVAAGYSPRVQELVQRAGGQPVTLTLRRGTTERTAIVQPREGDTRDFDGRRPWRLGIRLEAEQTYDRRVSTTLPLALVYPFSQLRFLASELTAGPPDPGGPVRIVTEYAQTTTDDTFGKFLLVWAMFLGAILFGLVTLADVIRAVLTLARKW